MTKNQISLIKQSFELIRANSSKVGKNFYQTLFAEHPDTKHLFKNNIGEQEKKLIEMLAVAVANIDDLSPVVTAVKDLGKRHIVYGVKAEHYDMVGSVLIKTFKQELKENFDTETEEAWKTLYGIVADTMQS